MALQILWKNNLCDFVHRTKMNQEQALVVTYSTKISEENSKKSKN